MIEYRCTLSYYRDILLHYLKHGDERSLYEAGELARSCMVCGVGPESLVQMHFTVFGGLMEDDVAEAIHTPEKANQVLLEAMMSYGLIYHETLQRKTIEYDSLAVYTARIEQQAAELRRMNIELERLNASAAALLRELEEKNEQLQELDRLKSQFVANMSHELRTPLTSILGFTSLMLQGYAGDVNPEQRRQLEMVQSSGNHLLDLINDVLSLSKLNAGKAEASAKPFCLSDTTASVVTMLMPQAMKKNLRLVTENMPPEDFVMYSDENKIKAVLMNLVNNAIKYTDTGRVSISTDYPPRYGKIAISVSDTGVGIEEESLQDIFDEFRQVERAALGDRSGVGLGLSISKKLADLLQGKICVESQYGAGTTFTLILPVELALTKDEESIAGPGRGTRSGSSPWFD